MVAILISKEQFLIEHNKLSPLHLQATLVLLTQFQEAKKPLLTDSAWSIDKLRMPLISWLLALPKIKEENYKKKALGRSPFGRSPTGEPMGEAKQIFKNYPETKL